MIDFDFRSPTRVILAKGAEERVGELISSYGFRRVLLVYGGGSVIRSGLLDRVKAKLNEQGVAYFDLGGVRPNPDKALVQLGKEMVLANGIDFLLAIGGGSSIDTAKSIAVNVYHDGDVMDYHLGKAKPHKAMPIGVILTLASAGSESSDSCVISDTENMKKVGFHSDLVRPLFALENPELTYTAPAYQTAAGIADMMMHTMERYFCPSNRYQLSDEWGLSLCKQIMDAGLKAMKEPNDYESHAALLVFSGLAHNGITGLGKSTGMTVHGLEHALSAYRVDITHGAGIAVCYLGWARRYYKELAPKFASFARYMFEINDEDDEKVAIMGINRMESFYKTIGLPTTLRELGLEEKDLPAIADLATGNGTRAVGRLPQPLDRDAVLLVYKTCL